MSLTDTLILVLYFFVLSILAIYGWHRYYLVYLYMKHKGNVPPAMPPPAGVAEGHGPAAHLQRDVCRGPADRRGLRDRLSPRPARDPGAGRLDGRDDRDRRARRAPLRRARLRHQVSAPRRPHRLQGGRARSRPEGGLGRVHRDLRRRLRSAAGLPAPDARLLRQRPQGGHGPGALGAPQPRLLAADPDPVDPPRRALRARARRAEPLGLLLQLQRHGGRLAARDDWRTPAAGSTTP